ncbi:MAG TPA: SCO family protein [Anaerolineales bacterium]|nr:SCO family protein [Anaerolineales bacterium]
MDKKVILIGFFATLFIAVVALGTVLVSKPAEFRGTSYGEPYPVAEEFVLTRFDESRFKLSEMRGSVVLLFFGYTSCPDICPTTLAELNIALQGISPDQAEDVNVVFVTVDPERDDPARVQEYVNHFNADFIGLSGTESELAGVWNQYGIFREIVEGNSAAGYLVNHTARVTLIDRQGNLRASFGFDTPVDDIVHDLKLVLKED